MFKVQGSEFRVQSSKFTVQSSMFTVQGSMFKVQCSEFTVQGLKFLSSVLDRTESKAVEYFGMAKTGNPFGEQEERLSGV